MAKTTKSEYHRRFFIIHFVAYLLVMGGVAAINYMFTPQTLWFIYPLIGWGIGVVMHFLFSVAWVKDESAQTKDDWKNKGFKRSFIIHLVLYLMVNILLLFINLTYSPDFLWIVFPAAGWGIALIMQLVFGLLWGEKTEDVYGD